jgi:hypothetical protein
MSRRLLRTRTARLALASLALAPLAGCQAPGPAPEPLSTERVLEFSAAGKAPEEIIGEIRKSRTVYVLRARDIKDLLDKGVDERVVDYMMETRIRDLERRFYYYSYPYPYYYGPFWPHIGLWYHYHH